VTDELGTQILASVNLIRSELTGHMQGEDAKIAGIEDKISDTREDLVAWWIAAENRHMEAIAASERRHSELIKSLESWKDKMDVTSGFPEDKKGKPDLTGHRTHHETLIEEAANAKARAEDLKRKWLDRAGWAAIVFIALAVWEYTKAHIK
jgi:hypothetical protein